ncbi:uncharacterized protein LOC126581057 [Anopheles aquasalis]|uniref:uncharacterized protein LOC126581057 n=1 Tax=Anopheles aquasalis TaxID=42839 RepID=UPI00215A4892|nr:uncharacterized protein LOC126581057 [Anopheles aquasalis]
MLQSMFRLAHSKHKLLCRYYVRKARNPGIDRRAALLQDDPHTEQELEQLDASEPTFNEMHKSFKQYQHEQAQYRDRLQTWIVGNKYFKTKQLNFLTWTEKEQIRYLHLHDSEEWSIDKLTESFPADRYTIAKIVKTKWQPKDDARIERHDATVKENWEMFRSGRIKHLDPGFAQHLDKFVQRNVNDGNPPRAQQTRVQELRPLAEGEFSAIVASCKKYKSEAKNVDRVPLLVPNSNPRSEEQDEELEGTNDDYKELDPRAPKQDMFIMGKVNDKRHLTLAEMKRSSGELESDSDRGRIVDITRLKLGTGVVDELERRYDSPDRAATVFDPSLDERDKASEPDIKEFIKIPSKLYKKGATYQVDDCFYDDDGEFLYRVPGMKGRNRKHNK